MFIITYCLLRNINEEYIIMREGFKDLKAYNLAYKCAKNIFEVTKHFPKEEKYSLTDQIRRSSRSVCANIAEAYRKRIYPNHFRSKISDADAECSEKLYGSTFQKIVLICL